MILVTILAWAIVYLIIGVLFLASWVCFGFWFAYGINLAGGIKLKK